MRTCKTDRLSDIDVCLHMFMCVVSDICLLYEGACVHAFIYLVCVCLRPFELLAGLDCYAAFCSH